MLWKKIKKHKRASELRVVMCEITIKVGCPHCEGTKVKKNGMKKNGKHIFLCHTCKKQFQFQYKNQGANPHNQRFVRSMPMNGSGVRDT